jgi:hypothetical protein
MTTEEQYLFVVRAAPAIAAWLRGESLKAVKEE